MGRGRAKAKQTKVARELKYRSVSTDFTSLERELRSPSDEIPDQYADLAETFVADADELPADDDDDEDESYPLRRSG